MGRNQYLLRQRAGPKPYRKATKSNYRLKPVVFTIGLENKYHKTFGDSWIVDGFANEYQKCRTMNLVDANGHIRYGHCFKLSSPDQKQEYIFVVASRLESTVNNLRRLASDSLQINA